MNEDTKESILLIYNIYHRGRENAITRGNFFSKYWEYLPDIADREFRNIYSQLPIITCDKGGYWPIRKEEIKNFREYMKKKAIPLFERFKMVCEAHPDLAEDAEQMELFI